MNDDVSGYSILGFPQCNMCPILAGLLQRLCSFPVPVFFGVSVID